MLIGLMERRRGGVDINILQWQLMNSVIKLFIDKMSSNVQGCVIMKSTCGIPILRAGSCAIE